MGVFVHAKSIEQNIDIGLFSRNAVTHIMWNDVMNDSRRIIVKGLEQNRKADARNVLTVDITFRPAPADNQETYFAPRKPYKIREKFSLRLPTFPSPPPKSKIRWSMFIGGPYIFYLRDGSTVIGRLVQQFQSFIKLVDVTIIRNGVRTKTRWMLQDGGEVKSFIPADAETEKVE